MAKKRRSSTARRSYYAAPKKKTKRRANTLNRSVKKPMQAAAVGLTLASLYGPAVVESVKTMKVAPIQNAVIGTFTNTDTALQVGKQVAVAYVGGTVAGIVADKTGLKRIVNKGLRTVRGLI